MDPSAAEELGIRTFTGPRARAGAVASALGVGVFALVIYWSTQLYMFSLDRMAMVSPDAAISRAGLTLKVLALVIGGLALGTAAYTARSCSRVLEHRQLPPPGAWVLGNPTVVSGTRAVVWGRVGYVLAALLAVTGTAFTYKMWQFVDLMMSGVGTLGI